MRLALAALACAAVCAVPSAAQQPTPTPPVPPPPASSPAQPEEQPQDPDAAPQEPPAAQGSRVLAADAGLIFIPVKPERVADFEKVVAKLKEALALSADPVRQRQAQGWKVFKAAEPGPNGTTLYVFLVDPAVKGSDYGFWKTMYDAFPADVQELYRLYTAAAAGGQTLLNLQLLADFRTPD